MQTTDDRELATRGAVAARRRSSGRLGRARSTGWDGPFLLVAGWVLVAGLAACSPTTGSEPTASASAGPPTAAASGPAEPGGTVPTADEHTAVGRLAPGFPVDLLPLPEDAEILVSTWAPRAQPGAGQPYDLSLNLRTGLPVADVAALYRASLTAAGFTETVGSPTAGLAAESTYSRSGGVELVTVGVLDRDGARTVSVGGGVHASG